MPSMRRRFAQAVWLVTSYLLVGIVPISTQLLLLTSVLQSETTCSVPSISDEGPKYQLGRITFQNNRAISNVRALRTQLPIRDGETFSRKKICKGLEQLYFAYAQLGYINFAAIPSTKIYEEKKLITLNIDLDEGKQFVVNRLDIFGLDPEASRNISNRFLLKTGQVYNERLVRMSMKRLSLSDPNAVAKVTLNPDEAAGTVEIAITFKYSKD